MQTFQIPTLSHLHPTSSRSTALPTPQTYHIAATEPAQKHEPTDPTSHHRRSPTLAQTRSQTSRENGHVKPANGAVDLSPPASPASTPRQRKKKSQGTTSATPKSVTENVTLNGASIDTSVREITKQKETATTPKVEMLSVDKQYTPLLPSKRRGFFWNVDYVPDEALHGLKFYKYSSLDKVRLRSPSIMRHSG